MEPISMDKVALWLGWKEININVLQEQVLALTKELDELKKGLTQPTTTDNNNVDLEDGTNADLEG